MIKFLKSAAIILILFILSNAATGYAQDSIKKAKPVVAKPIVKATLPKYNPYAKPKYNTYKATAAAPQQTPGNTPPTVSPTPVRQPVAENPALLNDKSLNGQYQYLLTKVYNYQRPLIAALWKNYNDTLNITRRKFIDASAKLVVQNKKIDSLQTDAGAKEQTLTASNARVDEIRLLGMPLTKTTYNLLMWGLVIGFGVIAALVIARSGAHGREARYRTKLYTELEDEYKAYKTKANEKEKKLARELQTERNKLDELKGNG